MCRNNNQSNMLKHSTRNQMLKKKENKNQNSLRYQLIAAEEEYHEKK